MRLDHWPIYIALFWPSIYNDITVHPNRLNWKAAQSGVELLRKNSPQLLWCEVPSELFRSRSLAIVVVVAENRILINPTFSNFEPEHVPIASESCCIVAYGRIYLLKLA